MFLRPYTKSQYGGRFSQEKEPVSLQEARGEHWWQVKFITIGIELTSIACNDAERNFSSQKKGIWKSAINSRFAEIQSRVGRCFVVSTG